VNTNVEVKIFIYLMNEKLKEINKLLLHLYVLKD